MTGPLLAVDLVSLEGRGWTIAGAGDVLAAHSIRSSDLVGSASENLREWSAKMRPVFMATDEEARCTVINGLLRGGTSRVYLTTHDQLSPHLHFTSDDDDVVSRVKAATAGVWLSLLLNHRARGWELASERTVLRFSLTPAAMDAAAIAALNAAIMLLLRDTERSHDELWVVISDRGWSTCVSSPTY